jgi:hypothetical protein
MVILGLVPGGLDLYPPVKTLRVYENTFEKHDFGHPKNPFVTGSPENP